jgi:HK97 family phage major capsid protein
MRDKIAAVKEQRASCIVKMREIVEAAETRADNPGVLTAEQQQEFDRLKGEAESLATRAANMEQVADIETREVRQIKPGVQTPGNGDPESREAAVKSFAEYMARSRGRSLDSFTGTDEYREKFYAWMAGDLQRDAYIGPDDAQLKNEFRALSKASAGAGLNLVPTTFRNQLIDALREFGVMRQLATVITTDSGETIQIPSVTTHGVSTWTAENAAITESDEAFGQLSLSAYANSRAMKVSWQLLTDAAFDLEAYTRQQFGISTGVLENTAYVVGDGSSKPTGITTQTSAGVTLPNSTAGVTGFSTSGAFTGADALIALKYSVLSPYRRNASWLMNDATVGKVALLKDSTNQYIWQPGLTAGAPDMLLGNPVYTDPDVPVMAASAKSILYGDFSWYWIRDVNGILIQRLNELFAMNGQVGFIVFHRTDGKLVNTAAVKHLANAAS